MKLILTGPTILLLLVCLMNEAQAQKYAFRYEHASDRYLIDEDGDRLFCLYKLATAGNSVYRKIFFNDQLEGRDSVAYLIPGDSELLITGMKEELTWHLFLTQQDKEPVWYFLVTTKDGKVRNVFSKRAKDFALTFQKRIKLKKLSVEVVNDANPDMLILKVGILETTKSALVALNLEDGSELWHGPVVFQDHITTTDSLVIGINNLMVSGPVTPTDIFFVNKLTGKRIKSTRFNLSGRTRNVAILTTNGHNLVLAGDEMGKNNSNKGSHLFVSMFDLEGKRIFDKVDTVDRNPRYRRRILASAFDRDGNLVLLGSGFRLDATRAAGSIAAGILLTSITGYTPYMSVGLDAKIDFVLSAVLSPEDGTIKSYNVFEVGPWYGFPNILTYQQHVLIGVLGKFLIYDTDMPTVPPEKFATLESREQLVLTGRGPVITHRKNSKKTIVMEFVNKEN